MRTQDKNANEHGFRAWVHRHKKGLIIGGAVVVAVTGGYFAFKDWDEIVCFVTDQGNKILPEPQKAVTPVIEKPKIDLHAVTGTVLNNGEAFEVSQHIRNLPTGHKASAAKVAAAIENGVQLNEGQTWVEAYFKNGVA